MLEFVFFNLQPQRRFSDFLRARGISASEAMDGETRLVAIAEDIGDALLDEIERFYDEMMALDRDLFEAEGTDGHGSQTAGVVLNLSSGQAVYAQVDPVLLGRIMEVLKPEEFGSIVNAIVDAVENPDARPLCRRPHEAD